MNNKGFTLIEMAVVLVILAALLSAVFMPFSAQRETANIRKAREELKAIEEAIYGFAIANNRLPCPTLPNQGGVSMGGGATNCQDAAGNDFSHGFVPARDLGIKGNVNCDGLILDPWGNPYRYSVTQADRGNQAGWDFVQTGQVKIEEDIEVLNGTGTLANITGDLQVCSDLSAACSGGTPAANILVSNALAVIVSMGKHWQNLSADEQENAGEGGTTITSSCGLPAYPIGNDEFFYSAERVEIAGSEFDDIVIWLSPNTLYSKFLEVGHLP